MVLGNADDARGFALAGWPARACPDGAALVAALHELRGRADLALLLVSADTDALAPRAADAFRDASPGTVVLVLP
jgi:hypothetical protein